MGFDTTISIDTHKKSIQYLDKNNLDAEYVDDCGLYKQSMIRVSKVV